MTTQSEQVLEDKLIKQLVGLGYARVAVTDDKALVANFKVQLERLNDVSLSDHAFRQILNNINKGSVFNRAKILRDRVTYVDGEGETRTVQLLDGIHLERNVCQVTQQVRMAGRYQNRYDVTILVNGLPLVQIELKRRGLELKEAFNQINRYEKHSYWSGHGLFQFVQLFVISNGVNTKYFANNAIPSRSYKQTFYWSSEDNRPITDLTAFATAFLNPVHLAKMITQYIVLNETEKMLMVLRPYQYYATEAIVERVKTSNHYGYIWHTTGSGKTLTSFKTAQLLTKIPAVHKVVFVVDRKDLDYQTSKEFNNFSKGSIDATENTGTLVQQLADDTGLIVTTIQKLNNAISKTKFLNKLAHLQDKKVVFIFDECHRSQFGDTHGRIKDFFQACQMFGFTGTPIFAENAIKNDLGKRTTAMLFGDCLHKYVITDAIRDGNVLKFSIEYINTFKQKQNVDDIKANDIKVEDINEEEVFNAPERLNLVTDYIIQNHARKTHNNSFTAVFCVSSIETLIQYFQLFLDKKANGEHNLKLATIFSYQANEEDQGAQGLGATDVDYQVLQAAEQGGAYLSHSRDHLEHFIGEYNQQFSTNFTTKDSKSFYNYYTDIAKRVKAKQIDILLVVNMFLTGFDSKPLNTLYVDKNLKFHGLIQAFSRTNRIYNELKSQGNIVCFRNLKGATDDAIRLFSSLDNKDDIIIPPYEDYLEKFGLAYTLLLSLAPTVDSVNDLQTEEDEFAFVKAFRALMRIKNVLTSFTDFSFDDLDMDAQEFEDYKSKYLDLYDKVHRHSEKEKVSILDDLDFELELIHRDEINVVYIVNLLKDLKDVPEAEQKKQKDHIMNAMMSEVELRSKRELIEKFINKHLPLIADAESVPDEFDAFWETEKQRAIKLFSETEQLDPEKLESVIGDFLYTNREPMREDVINMMKTRPKLKERATTAERLIQKVTHYVDTFVSGMGG
ncbi:type I restriction endonuclease subunit R [Marinicella gelatinilytica]|uniref:type I restriction endonuclease subunit R n=1 Tax=Marinicella gelatinilytica TaxID=2996017 RepID=UPI00226085B0|nr:type I restriction endonuclease subunit R [Marinicella gelatinilytica]MCX7546223.1 type I restriction endonuclease subunit R [Marinicella gelatinilytica]